jgi:penicillin-binding protein 1C
MKTAAFLIAVLAAWAAAAAAEPLPAYEEVRAAFQPSDALLLDRHGELLHELRTDPSRRRLAWTALEEISPALIRAVVQAEDRRFQEHGGVDFLALAAAAAERLIGRSRRGASTISMQVAALIDPRLQAEGVRGRRSLAQKWRQMRGAWRLEAAWGKARILEAYLNLVCFRGEIQGAGAAARVLCGRAPHGLDAGEALLLAALIRAPNAGRDAVLGRALAIGRAAGMAPSIEALAARAERLFGRPGAAAPLADLAPHVARRLLPHGRSGAAVSSTLDAGLQRFVRERLAHHLAALRAQRMGEGAAIVIDNASGEVLAYASVTTRPERSRFVDGVAARRQAGSTLKPFLYATAFDRRLLTPASLLDDSPLDLKVPAGIYQPRSYDGSYRGEVSARRALAASMNVPAVRVAELVGIEAFLRALRELGIGGLTEAGDFYGPSLALGTADVSLRELANAYRALANGGVAGGLLFERRPENDPEPGRRVFSAAAAFLIGDILSDREARSATFGLESLLSTRYWSAVKTGTSKDMRDNWCVGYSARHTVGVWVGNFSGEPMQDVSGLAGAAPVWREIMDRLHAPGAETAPRPPGEVVHGPGPPGEFRAAEWFIRGTEPPAERSPAAAAAPVIAYPPDGAVFALDPDIPADRQRILFVASSRAPGLKWYLNGRRLPLHDHDPAWPLSPGRHTLALAGAAGAVHDTVRFQVRAAPRRTDGVAAAPTWTGAARP